MMPAAWRADDHVCQQPKSCVVLCSSSSNAAGRLGVQQQHACWVMPFGKARQLAEFCMLGETIVLLVLVGDHQLAGFNVS